MWKFLTSPLYRRTEASWRPPNRPPDSWNYLAVEDHVVADAARRLGVSLTGDHAYGLGRKSAGAAVVTEDGAKMWLRVSGLIGSRVDARRKAEAEAQAIDGVPRPKTLRTLDWTQDGVSWRAILMTLAPSGSVSPYPWLVDAEVPLDDGWFDALRHALDQIKRANTQRVIFSPEQIKVAIASHFGDSTKSLATDWSIAHGDLQWSNVTAPELMILDWEDWGWAPRGFDAARLVAYAGLVPAVQSKLMRVFADDLETPSGQISLLLAVAVVRHDIAAGHADPALTQSLDQLAKLVRP